MSLAAALALYAAIAVPPERTVTVTATQNHGGEFTATFAMGTLSDKGTAQGVFSPGERSVSDFGSLSLTTSAQAPDETQMWALGFAEGVLTAQEIAHEVENIRWPILVHYGHLPSTDPQDFPELTDWLERNDAWTRSQAEKHAATSPFWRAQRLVTLQFDGLLAGVTAGAPELNITRWDIQLLNGVGDFFDLIPATTPSARLDFNALSDAELGEYIFNAGRCSGLIKVLPDFSNIFFSHSSWWSYHSMIRMMKHYETHFSDADIKNNRVSFSSYPGMLESLDDFYMMPDTSMAMVQTTNSMMNATLYDVNNNTSPESSVLAWQRVRIASLIGTSGATWHEAMSHMNSGTYENQYMVLDFDKFVPGAPFLPGLLTVGEQTPVRGELSLPCARSGRRLPLRVACAFAFASHRPNLRQGSSDHHRALAYFSLPSLPSPRRACTSTRTKLRPSRGATGHLTTCPSTRGRTIAAVIRRS